jgi:3-hydroxyacyl-[acyl-carrier-protein] dehydratase
VLKDSFYTILSLVPAEGKKDDAEIVTTNYTALVRLNEQHPLYQGHFPGNPVVPGVCQIEMIKEIFSEIIHKNVLLTESDTIKFLAIIVPQKYPVLEIKVSGRQQVEKSWDVNGTISNDSILFLKFKGVFREQ